MCPPYACYQHAPTCSKHVAFRHIVQLHEVHDRQPRLLKHLFRVEHPAHPSEQGPMIPCSTSPNMHRCLGWRASNY